MTARSHPKEGGFASTEIVLLTPVLLLLVMLVVQFGLWYHAQHVAQAAADEGLRGARAGLGSIEAGEARADAFLDQAASSIIEERVVVVTRDADLARVTVTGHAPAVIPGFSLPVRANATAPVERFREDDR